MLFLTVGTYGLYGLLFTLLPEVNESDAMTPITIKTQIIPIATPIKIAEAIRKIYHLMLAWERYPSFLLTISRIVINYM